MARRRCGLWRSWSGCWVLRIDPNLLAYAEGVGDAQRCQAARDCIARLPGNRVVLPAQTLGELHRVLTGKAGRSPKQAKDAILAWSDAFDVADSTFQALKAALDLVIDHHLPVWDALILSVAAEERCRLLLSEDFQHGFTWQGVTADSRSVRYRYRSSRVCHSRSM